jgi:glycosyltransferase involved in cell wall biosynthesis
VPPSAVSAHLAAADFAVHTSRWEGLPRVAPQAFLTHRALVATDVDGTREAVHDGQTGRLVPLDDLPALRAAILALARDPDERARMAEAGHAWAKPRYSVEAMVNAIGAVYARVLRESGANGPLPNTPLNV